MPIGHRLRFLAIIYPQKRFNRDRAINLFNDFTESLGELALLEEVSARVKNSKDILQRITDGALGVLNANLVDLYQYRQSLDVFPLPIVLSGDRRYPMVKDTVL